MKITSGCAALVLIAGMLASAGCGSGGTLEAGCATLESFAVPAVRRGQRLRAEISLRNRRPRHCSVVAWRTSCDCLSIEPATLALGPAEETQLTCVLDFSDEPDFAGDLAIKVEGLDVARNVVLAFEVRVSVLQP